MDTNDLAYVAGFFDGEGCCSLAFYRRKKSHHKDSYQFNVNITNTNRDVLLSIHKIVGLGDLTSNCAKKTNWKPAYKLWFPQHHVIKFLQLILPYLRLKRKQAELILQFVSTSDHSLKLAIYEELASLNKRGQDK